MSPAERRFEYLMRKSGRTFLKGGWPDYLVITKRGVRFVEVKGKDRLSTRQVDMLAALEAAGLRAEVWDAIGRKFSNWRKHAEKHRPYGRKPDPVVPKRVRLRRSLTEFVEELAEDNELPESAVIEACLEFYQDAGDLMRDSKRELDQYAAQFGFGMRSFGLIRSLVQQGLQAHAARQAAKKR